MKKALLASGLLGTGLAVLAQRKDIVRYLKIKQMSFGHGFPGVVPASGSARYPAPGKGAPDGTGEFRSADRGGPADR